MFKRYQYVSVLFSRAALAIAMWVGVAAFSLADSNARTVRHADITVSPGVRADFSIEDFRRELRFHADTELTGRLMIETQFELWLLPNYAEQFNELPAVRSDNDDDNNEIGEIEHTVKLSLIDGQYLPAMWGYMEFGLPLENTVGLSGYSSANSEISFGLTLGKSFSWGHIESKIGYRDYQGNLVIKEYAVTYSKNFTKNLAVGLEFDNERDPELSQDRFSFKSQINWSPASDMSMQFFGLREFRGEDARNIIGAAVLVRF